jgi:uncharacterized protein (DUF427 family)
MITVTPSPRRVRVRFAGEVVAESDRALVLREGSYPPVLYLPREDARMAHFVRTNHATHCPHKGDAAYFSLRVGDREASNAVWSYETPKPGVAAIAGHLAFYRDRVDAIEEVEA